MSLSRKNSYGAAALLAALALSSASIAAPHPRVQLSLPDLSARAPVAAPAASAGDVVYRWQKTVARDGTIDERVLVDTVLADLDAGRYSMDLDRLVDSRGRSYEMVADASQPSEDAPVVYTVELRRVSRKLGSDAELDAAFREAHPEAGTRELEAYRALRSAPLERPAKALEVAPPVLEWLDQAGPSDTIDVIVQLQETESPLRLPKVSPSLFNDEPVAALTQMKDRVLAIEARKNELDAIQRPFLADVERHGGSLLHAYWLINGVRVRVDKDGLESILRDARARRVEKAEAPIHDTNNLDDMRVATQVTQLHDAGYDGETSSGKSSVNDIYVGIIDSDIDISHPAWLDTASGSSRLLSTWREVAGFFIPVGVSATATPSHGTKVAGIAMADLMQGQDPVITTSSDRDDRTGFAPEASFSFIEDSGGTIDAIEQAVALDVDVINLSASVDYTCSLTASSNDAVDEAMLDGIFFAKSSGSNGVAGAACNIGTPGAASGAFSVAATVRTAVPLNTGLLTGGSSHGPDSFGRAVVAMAAPSGPEGSTDAQVGGGYDGFGATSAAAPVVAGAAAVLKDHMIDVFTSAIANEVGFVYAAMLVMGDGQTNSGVATAGVPMDGNWGAGRLRMRMATDAGMDGPWRFRLISRTISHTEIETDLYLNPDASGVNQVLSSDVDRIRASVFWHEPNTEDSSGLWANISSSICNETGVCYSSGNSSDPRQRLRLGNVAGGHTWYIKLNGLSVPVSFDSNYHYLLPERKVYVAVYWEDGDRDDANGPGSDIQ